MRTIDATREIERQGRVLVTPLLMRSARDGRVRWTDDLPNAEALQRSVGDALLFGRDREYGIEIKTEESNRHGNAFLETHSNLPDAGTPYRPGWLYTLVGADILVYLFLDSQECWAMPFAALRRWLFYHPETTKSIASMYHERRQEKHVQLNETWGLCVPWQHLENAGVALRLDIDHARLPLPWPSRSTAKLMPLFGR